MYDPAARLENGAMARAIPGPIGIVPGERASFMRADRGNRVQRAAIVAPDTDLFAVPFNDSSYTGRNLIRMFD